MCGAIAAGNSRRRRRSSTRANSRTEKTGKLPNEPDGTLIRFEPDPTIFKAVEFRTEIIERRLRHYSYLNTGLKLIYNGQTFQSRRGLMDLVLEDLQTDGSEPIYPPLRYASKTARILFHAHQ